MIVEDIRAVLRGDAQADRVVPPTGMTAHLTIFSAATMAFLAVFAVALSLAAGRLADRWAGELARSATVRISALDDTRDDRVETALDILRQTPGVAGARALGADEQAALLAPWFGGELPLDTLPMPQLIEITETPDGFDAEGLRLRLGAELPGAVLDDHARWRKPLFDAASGLRWLGWLSVLLIAGAVGAMITLAANAALAANAQVIEVLRLIGAKDSFIARAFVRRFTVRALIGAAAGMALGMIGVTLLPAASEQGSVLTGLGFRGADWLVPLIIPPMAATVAFLATRAVARRTLRGLR